MRVGAMVRKALLPQIPTLASIPMSDLDISFYDPVSSAAQCTDACSASTTVGKMSWRATDRSTFPSCTAALGIPYTMQESASCAIVEPPARFISPMASAPSLPIPVMRMPVQLLPHTSATERKSRSAARASTWCYVKPKVIPEQAGLQSVYCSEDNRVCRRQAGFRSLHVPDGTSAFTTPGAVYRTLARSTTSISSCPIAGGTLPTLTPDNRITMGPSRHFLPDRAKRPAFE